MSEMGNKSEKPATSRKERKTKISQPTEPFANKYYGAFKVEKWPEDTDGFIVKAMQKWQSHPE
jgi:hypothetical protein